jgi:hypothetical protein
MDWAWLFAYGLFCIELLGMLIDGEDGALPTTEELGGNWSEAGSGIGRRLEWFSVFVLSFGSVEDDWSSRTYSESDFSCNLNYYWCLTYAWYFELLLSMSERNLPKQSRSSHWIEGNGKPKKNEQMHVVCDLQSLMCLKELEALVSMENINWNQNKVENQVGNGRTNGGVGKLEDTYWTSRAHISTLSSIWRQRRCININALRVKHILKKKKKKAS